MGFAGGRVWVKGGVLLGRCESWVGVLLGWYESWGGAPGQV